VTTANFNVPTSNFKEYLVIRVLTLVSLLLVMAVGCARVPGGLSPSNIPLTPGGYTPLGPVKGSDCKISLFGVLAVSGGNQLPDAVAEAKRANPNADALVDISVDLNSKFFILWGQTCTIVQATAVSVP
jgi:hypothetical protein